MKIGIIVDGESELRTLSRLLEGWPGRPPTKVLMAHTDPRAPAAKQAAAILPVLRQLVKLNCSQIVILFDLEDDQICPGPKAAELARNIARACQKAGLRNLPPITVSYKVYK